MTTMLTKLVFLTVFAVVWASYEHEHHHPQPYHFGYEVKDKHGSQYRKEEGDGHGQVRGSYGYTDEKGIYREVHYVADKGGFRAEIKTNEPGTANQDPAHVKVHSTAKHEEEFHGFRGHHGVENHYDDSGYRRNGNFNSMERRQGDHGGHE